MSTRDDILTNGLNLFSKEGYNSVSIRQIARKVGIKESSIYNYFDSKEEIFKTIIDINEKKIIEFYYNNPIVKNIKCDDKKDYLYDLMVCLNMICEMFFDSNRPLEMKEFKNLLTIERFRNKEMEEKYNELFLEMPVKLISEVFEFLIENRFLKKYDSVLLAREYFYYIFSVLEGQKNEHKSISLIRQHISHFYLHYKD